MSPAPRRKLETGSYAEPFGANRPIRVTVTYDVSIGIGRTACDGTNTRREETGVPHKKPAWTNRPRRGDQLNAGLARYAPTRGQNGMRSSDAGFGASERVDIKDVQ
jgi:hypothetical protein